MALLVLVTAYVLGSIPFGLLITRAAGYGDVRNIGSGNIGATNVYRTGHKGLAALTLLLDMLKGVAAVYLTVLVSVGEEGQEIIYYPIEKIAYLAAILVVIGHIFPLWLKFKGGKGVATAFGAALGLNPLVGLAGLAVWLITFAYSRISSLSALLSIALMPVVAGIMLNDKTWLPLLIIAVLVIWRHKANIERLFKREEPKFGRHV